MVGLPWHKRDHSARYDETRRISMLAKGMLSDLVDTMYRTGKPLAYDIAYLCHVCAVRDKRQIEKPLQELITAGLIIETADGLTNPAAMAGIAEANRHIANGKGGGRPAKAKGQTEQQANRAGSLPDHYPTTNGTQGSSFVENQQVRRNPIDQDQDKKNPPPTPSTSPGQNGGGGSEIQQIIAGFDSRIVAYWGEESRREEQAKEDAQFAGQWLAKAGGSVEAVLKAVDAEMEKERTNNRRPPGSLKAYRISVPAEIGNGPSMRSTNGSGKSLSYAGPSRAGGNDVWPEICSLARNNWHDDVAIEIRRRAVEISDEEANRFAESMRSLVSTKKAMAAA